MTNASVLPDVLFSSGAAPRRASHLYVLANDGQKSFPTRNVAGFSSSIEELRPHITLPNATIIIIAFEEVEHRVRMLRMLRATPELALLPLMISESTVSDAPETADLSDGRVATPEAARERGEEILSALRAIKGGGSGYNADTRLLRFLHTRPEYKLIPRRSWHHPLGYHYPLLEVFGRNALECGNWLTSLAQRKLIEPVALIARTRHCHACDYAHLNYVDVCPSCADADIENIPFLHCFACGSVAPDTAFARTGHLACPKCSARLRQIGVDYDRALTSFRCKACSASFQDPRILAECLHCGKRSAPSELSRYDVRSWRASELGHAVARSGEVAAFTPLDSQGFSAPWYFRHTVEWIADLRERNEACSFGILSLHVKNHEQLRLETGRTGASLILEELALRVRQVLRSTDLVTRVNESELYALLPHTDRAGCERTRAKIERASEDFRASVQGKACTTEIAFTHSSDLPERQSVQHVLAGFYEI